MKTVHGCPVDLTAQEARAVIAQAMVWQERAFDPIWENWEWETYIRYDDKTRVLARTDLYDDIRTSSMTKLRDPKKSWTKRIRYGARIDDEGFFVIDQETDG